MCHRSSLVVLFLWNPGIMSSSLLWTKIIWLIFLSFWFEFKLYNYTVLQSICNFKWIQKQCKTEENNCRKNISLWCGSNSQLSASMESAKIQWLTWFRPHFDQFPPTSAYIYLYVAQGATSVVFVCLLFVAEVSTRPSHASNGQDKKPLISGCSMHFGYLYHKYNSDSKI